MSRPFPRITLKLFRVAAAQVSTEFDDFVTSGGDQKSSVDLMSRFSSDPHSSFVLGYLREMLGRPAPFPEQVAALRLQPVLSADDALPAVRVLSDLRLFEQREDPTGAGAVFYKVDDRLRAALDVPNRQSLAEIHELLTRRPGKTSQQSAVELARNLLAWKQLVEDQQRQPTIYLRLLLWIGTAFARLRTCLAPSRASRGTRNRALTEVEILGASIDQTTDSFNEILNFIGPPPESSDDQQVTPPTVPAGVS